MEKFLKKHLGRGGNPTPERGEGKGPKNPTNANQGGGKGRGHLRAMNEVKPDAGTPPLFYCKPVNDKGCVTCLCQAQGLGTASRFCCIPLRTVHGRDTEQGQSTNYEAERKCLLAYLCHLCRTV